MDEFSTMPGHLIRRVHQISTALFAEECAGLELTAVQYAALAAIGAHPGVDATRLSTLIAFDRSTIGDVLERLEIKGWIERGASPLDRRVKLVSLSREGRQLLRRALPAVRRVQKRLLLPLPPADQAVFLRVLGMVASHYNEDVPAPLRASGER
jgi:DNA-binding MarR family transcriptional regulator